ncbi:MAG: SLBB domain-containing protein [Phycisphaerales bacterium]|nr:SLBB domain-containing protein [Phycisphaerales bacterium]
MRGVVFRGVRGAGLLCAALLVVLQVGCAGTKGFFDPSKTGYFHRTPTTMPILDRIDAIEPAGDPWGETSAVSAEDLRPNELIYRLHPGDRLDIQLYELYQTDQFHPVIRTVDQGGYVTIPEIGPLPAAGYTVDAFQQSVVSAMRNRINSAPTVSVSLIEGAAFNYIIYGHVPQPGRFTLSDPQLRLLEAITMAGGLPLTTKTIYVVRQVSTAPEHAFSVAESPSATGQAPATTDGPSLEDLINALDNEGESPAPSPGVFTAQAAAPVDIEDIQAADAAAPSVEAGSVATDSWVYIPEQDRWVEVAPDEVQRTAEAVADASPMEDITGDMLEDEAVDHDDLVLERVIEVDYQRLSRGENDLNLVIRPGDQIFVDGPPQGLYYIEGEVMRPGVFDLPSSAEPLTLSRAVAAAGGLGALAVPDRVDLVRLVGNGREATIRLDLGAIRSRTEPDVYLKPGDHIIVGTDFWAYPLAVFRNGLRANYGFGFLLDRNFGNDVFGPPPVNVVGG